MIFDDRVRSSRKINKELWGMDIDLSNIFCHLDWSPGTLSQITRFTWPTWGPPRSFRPQVELMQHGNRRSITDHTSCYLHNETDAANNGSGQELSPQANGYFWLLTFDIWLLEIFPLSQRLRLQLGSISMQNVVLNQDFTPRDQGPQGAYNIPCDSYYRSHTLILYQLSKV